MHIMHLLPKFGSTALRIHAGLFLPFLPDIEEIPRPLVLGPQRHLFGKQSGIQAAIDFLKFKLSSLARSCNCNAHFFYKQVDNACAQGHFIWARKVSVGLHIRPLDVQREPGVEEAA